MTKLVAMLGWKYEPDYMMENFKKNMNWVDELAILDCRKRDELWIHEGDYRARLRDMARDMQADWVLVAAPDERYEASAGRMIRSLIDGKKDKVIYEFNLKCMYTPTQYRVDGIWNKTRMRLYPLLPDQEFHYQEIQCPSMPKNQDYRVEHVDINIYHLKMIEPENRVLRAKVFNKLDPTCKFQSVGYDYIADETGLMLETIPRGREYFPEYKKYIFKVPEKYL